MTPFIVYGGPSSENEVSQKSKDLFLELLVKHNPVLVEWKKDMRFQLDDESEPLDIDSFFDLLRSEDAMFVNALHGEFGEDGWIQEKLENAGVPFTGPSSKAAKDSMDKEVSQQLVNDLVRTIPSGTFVIGQNKESIAEALEFVKANYTGYPIFIKPNAKGSSVGIYKIHSADELEMTLPILPPDKYLVQPEITGTEISIGAVFDQGTYLNLPATEIVPKTEFFDYKAKYSDGYSEEITPARISDSLMQKIKDASILIHKRLNLGCYSRTDMIITPLGELTYLETNSLPGMTKNSLIPQQLRAVGKLEEFGEIMLRNANLPPAF